MSVPAVTTASGRQYRLLGPELDAPFFPDIAHHLSQINRYSGACSRPYSVAEHSLLCDHIAASRGLPIQARRAVFAHDWHEAYVNDAIGPVKAALALMGADWQVDQWDALESLHAAHVREHFGLGGDFHVWGEEVKLCDRIALATERAALMPDDGLEWEILKGVEPARIPLNTLWHRRRTWENWHAAFCHRAGELWGSAEYHRLLCE